MRVAARAEAEAPLAERRLEDWIENHEAGSLHDTVAHARDPEWPGRAIFLRDEDTAERAASVLLARQAFRELLELGIHGRSASCRGKSDGENPAAKAAAGVQNVSRGPAVTVAYVEGDRPEIERRLTSSRWVGKVQREAVLAAPVDVLDGPLADLPESEAAIDLVRGVEADV